MARLARHGLAGLTLLPFCAAIMAHSWSTSPGAISGAEPLPPLAFDQYAVNLREVAARPVIQAHFDFVNHGKKPVTITKLDPSCGCLAPEPYGDKWVYEPGERGRFYVSMRTANERPGPHAYSVDVHYEDSDSYAETVTFRLTLPEKKLSVEPPEIYFYQLSGADDERTIHVTDYRGMSTNVTGASCTLDDVSVEVLPGETDDEGHARTPIRISVPGHVEPGRRTGYLVIQTDDPDFQRVFAAVLVEGPSEVQPASFESAGEDDAE